MRAAVVLLAVIATTDAAADGFAWQAPVSCPGAAEVLARIEHRLDRDTRVRDIEVTVVQARAGYTATIETSGAQRRTLNAASCRDLADAVAVIVARIAIEAQQRAVEAAPAEPPAPAPVVGYIAPPRRERPLELGATLVATPAPRWSAGLRLLAVSGIGVTPKVGYGGELAGYLQRGSTFAELGYARWADRPTSSAPEHLDIGVSLIAVRGGWSSERMPLRAWGGFEIGAMHGVPQGIEMSATSIPTAEGSSGRWIAVASGLGVSWPMTPHLRLTGTFEVAIAVASADFRFDDGTRIYEPDRLSARCALGLEVAWR